MKGSRSARPRSVSVKLTAMIDMAFLLITFFVMSIRFGQAGEEEITLPDADQASEVTQHQVELVTVNVTHHGNYIVNAVQQSSRGLLRHLKERKRAAHREIEVVIRGDRGTAFESVQRAMRLAAEAGIAHVSLAALQSADEVAEK